ncbi:hypothetical protein [Janibacter cremeus]|uniref:MinD-like ATPase involved in chromosome partitioning or flagellar assembly n=1 Tax=Janibacter cremeus TaxID=1285192 RepID=A0A852VU02_9MICO|nr:hypothetical protein [Janibacter cremeus]NYF97051.1 MinD-like ATPase involved in chromosome partitioning or flagellar assembly [Janibacter cremeus]
MGGYGISIDGEGIANLGDRLGSIADLLEEAATRTSDVAVYGFPSGTGERAMDGVLGDQELVRVEVCDRLRALRDLAQDAGGCFISAERQIGLLFRGTS